MLDLGSIETETVEGPVEFATLRAGSGPSAELPILVWLHGGGGSERFLETCRPQFNAAWLEGSIPDLVAVTPNGGWSGFLDRFDGSEKWEQFIVEELIPRIRKKTGSVDGAVYFGGVSSGATAALRLAFKNPDICQGVVAIEPLMPEALEYSEVLIRDRVAYPGNLLTKLHGDPVDVDHWEANHPPSLVVSNGQSIAASDMAIYVECGDNDTINAHFGSELLHRVLFDVGISHQYQSTMGADHVGSTIGPRIIQALRFLGSRLKPQPNSSEQDAEVEAFAAQVAQLQHSAGYRRTIKVRTDNSADVEVHIEGEGPRVVLVPSLGRGTSDMADLGARLARSGMTAVRPEPRGIDGSTAELAGITINHFAHDIAAVIESVGAPAGIIGHDFGAQVAQMVAILYPSLVSSLVLLSPPGPVKPEPGPATALRRIFVDGLDPQEHAEAVALALFADGGDTSSWLEGWHRSLAFAQAEAERHVPLEELWSRLAVDTLVVQPTEDRVVPPENAHLIADKAPGSVQVVMIPGAGHALLPEQPEALAAAALGWFRR